MSSSTPKHTNALASEKSPYLQQHAHNPVNWMPWGEAAFKKARDEDKPILLSIGYSTCHWCHVMERESFENEAIAAVLNEHFINVKVDREERPDVDLTYMTYVQAVNGSGGWPMNVWLTPELKPFFGGTYFPPEDKAGRMGFKRLSEEIARVWREDKANVIARSHETVEKLQGYINDEQNAHDASFDTVSKKAYDDISGAFDYHEGGFSTAPKFPRPVTLNLLWRLKSHLARKEETSGDANWAEAMAKTTLTKMAHGGMRDHLGGGFHRYSVDGYWHIPHYEKMLYDQAQLAVAYLEGHQITGSPFYASIARSTLEYCQRDLGHPDGGYYSAEDADSYQDHTLTEKSEGAYYIWTAAEIDELLGKQEGSIFRYAYGARRDGNARPESDPQGELKGTNTLFRAFSVKKTAEFFKLEEPQIEDILTRGRATLLEARGKRPHPHLDDKIITAWNGMMLSALAKAASILNDPAYLTRAKNCATFLKQNLSTDGKNLRRSWRNGQADDLAFAPDYALLIQGLLDLYEATFELPWLQWAVDLQNEFDTSYGDPEKGGYYTVSKNIPNSVLQVKEDYDGAEPSPNSIASLNLLRLASMLARDSYRDTAAKTLNLFGQSMEKAPITVPAMVTALDYQQHGNMEIVFAGNLADPTMQDLVKEVRQKFLPHAVLLHADGGESQAFLAQANEAIAHMQPVGGKPSVYVCKNHTCQAPVTTVEALNKALQLA
ncbi:thioredoxin domain-containing protein [Phragmitibacter flavus]|uniref:Thioredoxin domain-containing protein n=1 Tax=Phragmitibacter flavus TaxID=2576071 RepID=A0A5R8KE73_9BACT|nr:thioredoxin domain-containing protein [Phragmitibacter flavus]TLD70580.1 thioredoxin domain-containing protein [Phragmitibacter flavus]